MAEGQTRLMQQVAETNSCDVAGWHGQEPRDFRPPAQYAKLNLQRDRMLHIVKDEVLPRVSVGYASPVVADPVDDLAVAELVGMLLRPDHEEKVDSYVDDALARGLPIEHVFLRLFQPAARYLGELWVDDRCSFVDVTLGMATLQSMLRRLAPSFYRHGLPVDGRRSALLTTLPDDQHTFGVNMAAEFFRRAGWNISTGGWSHTDELTATLRGGGYSVVGFSVSREGRLDELASVIRSVRRACDKGTVGILVGGPLFIAHPDYAIRVGADAVGLDARQALAQAEAFAIRAESH